MSTHLDPRRPGMLCRSVTDWESELGWAWDFGDLGIALRRLGARRGGGTAEQPFLSSAWHQTGRVAIADDGLLVAQAFAIFVSSDCLRADGVSEADESRRGPRHASVARSGLAVGAKLHEHEQQYGPLESHLEARLAVAEAACFVDAGARRPARLFGLRQWHSPGIELVLMHRGPDPPSRAGLGPLEPAGFHPRECQSCNDRDGGQMLSECTDALAGDASWPGGASRRGTSDTCELRDPMTDGDGGRAFPDDVPDAREVDDARRRRLGDDARGGDDSALEALLGPAARIAAHEFVQQDGPFESRFAARLTVAEAADFGGCDARRFGLGQPVGPRRWHSPGIASVQAYHGPEPPCRAGLGPLESVGFRPRECQDSDGGGCLRDFTAHWIIVNGGRVDAAGEGSARQVAHSCSAARRFGIYDDFITILGIGGMGCVIVIYLGHGKAPDAGEGTERGGDARRDDGLERQGGRRRILAANFVAGARRRWTPRRAWRAQRFRWAPGRAARATMRSGDGGAHALDTPGPVTVDVVVGERRKPAGRRAMALLCIGLAAAACAGDMFQPQVGLSRSPFAAVRVGEAINPGPAPPDLPCSWVSSGSGLHYPPPHRDGFRAIATPGFQELEAPQPEVEQFGLTLETVNTTGWRALRRRLTSSKAHVILAQETWLGEDGIAAASRWALRHGWKSLWCPAERGARGGPAAGTAVLTRDWLGLRHPHRGGHRWHQSRACAGIVDAPGYRPLVVVSAYCHHGQGASDANVQLLAGIGAHFTALGPGWSMLVGADFNMQPQALAGTGVPAEMDADIVASSSARGTCRTRTAARNYDYFLAAGEVRRIVSRVGTVEGSGNKTHTPVQLALEPKATALKALHLRAPPRLPTERVFGPQPPTPAWQAVQPLFDEAAVAVKTLQRDRAEAVLSAAYALWAHMAEEELGDATGHPVPRAGTRSTNPSLVWRSVIPEQKPLEGYPTAAALTWLRDLGRELARAAARAQDAAELRRAANTVLAAMNDDAPHGTPCDKVIGEAAKLLDIIDRICAETPERVVDEGAAGIVGGDAPPVTREAGIIEAIEDFIKEAGTALKTQEDIDGQIGREKWRRWLREDLDRGASNAHAYSRVQGEWQPSEVEDSTGVVTASPAAILEAFRGVYSEKWKAGRRRVKYAWREREALRRLTSTELRAAAGGFSVGTAATYDGFHPRHFFLLSDAALDSLAAILEMVEILGAWPSQVDLVVMPLLPKPRGGYRPIGLLPGIYRLWAKARRAEADRWEAANPRSYFAAASGTGPIDAVWKQAARQEAGVSEGSEAAAVMEDMESFYELMSRPRLLAEADRLGFPTAIVRASLAAYSAPRLLSMRGCIGREANPCVGIIAGCALATTYVKIYYLDMYDELKRLVPTSVEVDVYIDDTVMTAEGPPQQVAADLAAARRIFARLVTERLGGRIAEGKSAAVATSRATAVRLKALCGIGGPVTSAMTDLGIDFTAAKRRGASGRGKRQERARRAVARRRRLSILRSVIGEKARSIFTVGVAPSAAYDAPVWGITDQEVVSLRRTAAAALRPTARNRSLTMAHLLHQLPTARFEVAPVVQYARAVWKANTARTNAAMRKCALPDIRGWWEATMSEAADIVATYDAAGVAGDGKARRRSAAKAWRRIRGPIGAAALTLRRIGWSFTSPFTVTDDRGVEITLTHTTPQLLTDQLTEGVRRSLERQVAAKWAGRCASFSGRRACTDLAVAGIRAAAKTSPLGAGAYRAAVCGAIMTRSRAAAGGYDVLDECPLCGEKGDTERHRIYGCCKSAETVAAAVPAWFIEEARKADPADPFWVTGVFPHPADLAPLPASGVTIVWDDGPEDVQEQRRRDGAPEPPTGAAFGGNVYFDGSSAPHVIRDLSRAAAAVVMVDDNGGVMRRGLAAVPNHLPQTSQAAEGLGLAVSIRSLEKKATVHGDCLAVVNAANAPGASLVAGRRKHGGLLMDILRDPDRRRLAGDIKWVKAHRRARDDDGADTLRDIRGNDAADLAANEARDLHPDIGDEARSWAAYYAKRAPLVAKAAAAALPLFPPAPGNMARKPRPTSERQAVEENAHLWRFSAGAWRCVVCASWTRRKHEGGGRQGRRCPGPLVTKKLKEYTERGHSICRAEGEMPFVFCSKCGGWAAKRSRLLGAKCSPPTAAGRLALKRIAAGWHPWRRKGADGGEEERTTVRAGGAVGVRVGPDRRQRPRLAGGGEQRGPAVADDGARPAADGVVETSPSPGQPFRDSDATTDLAHGHLSTPAAADGGRRDPRVDGASMRMLIATIGRTSAHLAADSPVTVFNGREGRMVTTTIGAVEAERDWLRQRGVRDDDGGEASTGHPGPRRRAADAEPEQPATALGDRGGEGPRPPAFSSREAVIAHLRRGAEASEPAETQDRSSKRRRLHAADEREGTVAEELRIGGMDMEDALAVDYALEGPLPPADPRGPGARELRAEGDECHRPDDPRLRQGPPEGREDIHRRHDADDRRREPIGPHQQPCGRLARPTWGGACAGEGEDMHSYGPRSSCRSVNVGSESGSYSGDLRGGPSAAGGIAPPSPARPLQPRGGPLPPRAALATTAQRVEVGAHAQYAGPPRDGLPRRGGAIYAGSAARAEMLDRIAATAGQATAPARAAAGSGAGAPAIRGRGDSLGSDNVALRGGQSWAARGFGGVSEMSCDVVSIRGRGGAPGAREAVGDGVGGGAAPADTVRPGEDSKRPREVEAVATQSPAHRLAALRRRVAARAAAATLDARQAGRAAGDEHTAEEQHSRQGAAPLLGGGGCVGLRGIGGLSADCSMQAEEHVRPLRAPLELVEPALQEAATRQVKTLKCTSSSAARTTGFSAEGAAACLGTQPSSRASSPRARSQSAE